MYCETFNCCKENFVEKRFELHMSQRTMIKMISENMSTSVSTANITKNIYVAKIEMKRFCSNKVALATEPFESSIWSYLEKFRVRRVASAVPLKLHLKLSREVSSTKSRFCRPTKAPFEVISRIFE